MKCVVLHSIHVVEARRTGSYGATFNRRTTGQHVALSSIAPDGGDVTGRVRGSPLGGPGALERGVEFHLCRVRYVCTRRSGVLGVEMKTLPVNL